MANLLRRRTPVPAAETALDLSRILLHADPGSEHASQLRSLAQEVFSSTRSSRRLAVIPIDQGRASRLICNVAYAVGETQQRIALIEADFRSPQVATRFRLPSSAIGLAGVLEEKAPLAAAECQINSWLTIIPSGQSSIEPPGLLNSPRLSDIVHDVAERHASTLVYCPPASQWLDYSFIVRACDGIVIVAQKDRSRMAKILAVRDQIERLGVPIVYAMLENGKF